MSKKNRSLTINIKTSDGVKNYTLNGKSKFSIGYKPTNTFQLFGDQVPAKFELISGHKNGFKLKVQESMQGEVIVDESSLNISDLIKHQLLPWEKDGYTLNISENKLAKINYNGFNFKFECDSSALVAANEIAYWKFSRRIYRRLTSDLLFKVILLILFTLGSFVSYKVHLMPLKLERRVNIEKYVQHVAKIVLKNEEPQPIVDSNIGVTGNQENETDEIDPQQNEPAEQNSPNETTSRESAKKTVLNKGLLGLIAGEGASNSESSVIESLIDRGLVHELDDILKNTQNMDIELPSMTDIGGDLNNLLSNSKIEVDNLISGMEVDDGVELKEKGEVTLESFGDISGMGATLGFRSEQSIRDDILKYDGLSKYIYNKYLKLDPKLSGKIVLEIVIDASGKITKCNIKESTMNNQKFENELRNVVMTRFNFKTIPEGEVTVLIPYVFVPPKNL